MPQRCVVLSSWFKNVHTRCVWGRLHWFSYIRFSSAKLVQLFVFRQGLTKRSCRHTAVCIPSVYPGAYSVGMWVRHMPSTVPHGCALLFWRFAVERTFLNVRAWSTAHEVSGRVPVSATFALNPLLEEDWVVYLVKLCCFCMWGRSGILVLCFWWWYVRCLPALVMYEDSSKAGFTWPFSAQYYGKTRNTWWWRILMLNLRYKVLSGNRKRLQRVNRNSFPC